MIKKMNNFTAHEIVIIREDGNEVIPSCGYEIRLNSKPTTVKEVCGVPVRTRAVFTGLAFFKNGKPCSTAQENKARQLIDESDVIIVSTMTAKYMKGKWNTKILSPSTEIGDTVRDANGKIIGIKALQFV